MEQSVIAKKVDELIDTETFFFGLPVISKGKDWIRVNNLLIRQENNLYYIRQMGYPIAEFCTKSWAIAYAISFIKMDRNKCDYLKKQDALLRKHLEDISIYKHHLVISRKNRDITKENIFSDRLCRSEIDCRKLITDVNKNIKTVIST